MAATVLVVEDEPAIQELIAFNLKQSGHVALTAPSAEQAERRVLILENPGMPGASPGMDLGKDPYDVLTFDVAGQTTVWAKH